MERSRLGIKSSNQQRNSFLELSNVDSVVIPAGLTDTPGKYRSIEGEGLKYMLPPERAELAYPESMSSKIEYSSKYCLR
jgi:hypothetical protein